MTRQLHQEWPDLHRNSPYPFKDTSTLRAKNGDFVIDNRWFIEARLWPTTNSSRIHLKSIERIDETAELIIASVDGELATAHIELGENPSRAVFIDAYSNQVGYIETSVGGFNFLRDFPEEKYVFSVNATEFIPTVVTPQSRHGVYAISDAEGSYITDDFRIVGGEGVELVVEDNKIYVNIVGDSLYARDVCEDPEKLGRLMNPIRAIKWEDRVTGHRGTVLPKRGRIITAITRTNFDDKRDRGHQSPGPDGTIVDQMG